MKLRKKFGYLKNEWIYYRQAYCGLGDVSGDVIVVTKPLFDWLTTVTVCGWCCKFEWEKGHFNIATRSNACKFYCFQYNLAIKNRIVAYHILAMKNRIVAYHLLLLWARHHNGSVRWIRINSTVSSTIVLVEFSFCAETFAACSARIWLITCMQSISIQKKAQYAN